MVVDSTEDVPPIVEPVAMEVQSPLVDQTNALNTCRGSYPPLPMQETYSAGNAPGKSSYANVTGKPNGKKLNIRKRVAYPVVANYIRNTWSKYGLVRSMFSSSIGLFSFQFSSMDGLDAMLENGPWFIRNNPLILKKWHPNENILKEDVNTIPGRSSYARVMIELRADVELKDNIVMAMPRIKGDGYYTCNIRVEYEWKPPRCACCKVFQHVSKKSTANTRGKMNNPKSTKEISKSNPFEMLTSADNDVNLGTNGGIANSADKGTNNVSSSNTPISEKIDKIERQICEGKLRFVDDDGNPFVSMDTVESDSEVEVVFDETTNLRISTSGKDGSDKGYGTNSLLEQ
ncbi:nucleotide-diphospho-sugar transferase [Tanacetum coccineum]